MSLDAYIAQRFQGVGVRFFHAENVRDFRNYCAAGAVLCREELMRRDPAGYTVFYSDEEDARQGVLRRVFGNLYDFGQVFARGTNAVPNVYGPITLVFKPSTYSRVHDIRITPQSIASLHAQWASSVVSTSRQVDNLLTGDGYGNPLSREGQWSEVSFRESALSFESLEYVLVEPLWVSGQRLSAVVEAELRARDCPAPVREREMRPAKREAIQELVALCEGLQVPANQRYWRLPTSRLPPVFRGLPPKMRTRVALWCRYFTYGTVKELNGGGSAQVQAGF